MCDYFSCNFCNLKRFTRNKNMVELNRKYLISPEFPSCHPKFWLEYFYNFNYWSICYTLSSAYHWQTFMWFWTLTLLLDVNDCETFVFSIVTFYTNFFTHNFFVKLYKTTKICLSRAPNSESFARRTEKYFFCFPLSACVSRKGPVLYAKRIDRGWRCFDKNTLEALAGDATIMLWVCRRGEVFICSLFVLFSKRLWEASHVFMNELLL